MSNDPRTTEQLRAEIAALKSLLEERTAAEGKRAAKRATNPSSQGSATSRLSAASVAVTRRTAFSMWLAPLMLLRPAAKAAKKLAKAAKRRKRLMAV